MSQEPHVIVPEHVPPVALAELDEGQQQKLDTIAHHVRGILSALGLPFLARASWLLPIGLAVVLIAILGVAWTTLEQRQPWPLALTDMLPLIRNANPPNMRFSVTPGSDATSVRIRSASSSS